jgi:eukaryotic-like serine/threonine-protein kinase
MSEALDLRHFEGTVVGDRFELTRFLDEGNFGAVFRASHLAYGETLREVAIKIAKEPMDNRRAREVFGDALAMARISEQATDPRLRDHFVTVHDAGRFADGPLKGHPYLVMELVRGGSVKSFLRSGSFPLKRTVGYFTQILDAVAFMHEGTADRRAIVHRDLKPANMLVSRQDGASDVLKVSDFGLVVEVETLIGWAESGGDLAYLAPESFSSDICSAQSDVYMLGLTFYEMLTGENPFAEIGRHLRGKQRDDRDAIRTLHFSARAAETFPALDAHEEMRLNPGLGKVMRDALALDCQARPYANAGDLRVAFHDAIAGRAPAAPRHGSAWSEVARLANEAESHSVLGDHATACAKLARAVELNRDPSRVPDAMLVGKAYLLEVDRLIEAGEYDAALKLAHEGHRRRICRSTLLAMARAMKAKKSPAAPSFFARADTCKDTE